MPRRQRLHRRPPDGAAVPGSAAERHLGGYEQCRSAWTCCGRCSVSRRRWMCSWTNCAGPRRATPGSMPYADDLARRLADLRRPGAGRSPRGRDDGLCAAGEPAGSLLEPRRGGRVLRDAIGWRLGAGLRHRCRAGWTRRRSSIAHASAGFNGGAGPYPVRSRPTRRKRYDGSHQPRHRAAGAGPGDLLRRRAHRPCADLRAGPRGRAAPGPTTSMSAWSTAPST